MQYRPENPLIVQSDNTLMLETIGPHFEAARDQLARFAELMKSPEYLHTYRVTPLSLWNAAASGVGVDDVVGALERWAKYPVPPNVPVSIRETMGRYGRLKLIEDDDGLVLVAADPLLMREIRGIAAVKGMLGAPIDDTRSRIDRGMRGELKQALIGVNHPVEDLAGFTDGGKLELDFDHGADDWHLRKYQDQAIGAFLGDGGPEGGSGVVVLPCGAGKTIVGLSVMVRLGMKTLILCTNVTALRQWRDEILARTTLTEDELGEYSGHSKEIRAVTLTTYQMLTWRASRNDDFVHFGLFDAADWGLVIYDEVHLLPAPVFRTVAHLQARRRLGLTATLVREDGRQDDVFALIGPKRFDMPWKDLEHQGWIATARCVEVRLTLSDEARLEYAIAEDREKYRIASMNPAKLDHVRTLLDEHAGERTLIIGMYVAQLEQLARELEVPLITGRTKQAQRDECFQRFRDGDDTVIVVSKVANFSVDLPDASVAIQISGTWGSRQEEAQRLGRVLRPKADGGGAWFYTLVSRDTVEQDFAERRQLFLAEQGYSYTIHLPD